MKKQSKISIHYRRRRDDGTLSYVLIVKWNHLVNPNFKLFGRYGLPTTSRWDTYNNSAEVLSGAIRIGGWHTLIKGYASPSKSSVTALTEKALKLLKKDPILWPYQTTMPD